MDAYIVLALFAMFFFGLNAIILKIAQKIDAISLALISVVTATVTILLYWMTFASNKQISLHGVSYGIASGVVYGAAIILFISAIKLGKVSVVTTIMALSAGVAIIIAVLFLSEKLTIIQGIGIVLALIAAALLSA